MHKFHQLFAVCFQVDLTPSCQSVCHPPGAQSPVPSLRLCFSTMRVGTEIRTVDFRLNKETKKTLVSQRTRISVNYHTSSNQNTRITTIKLRNRKESKVDLIPNLRMSVTTRYKPGLESCRRDSYSPLCSSPRTPYILAPRSVYAFTLLPLSRHSIKMEIFHFSRSSQLSSKLPPSVNQAVVYGLLIRKIVGWASSRVLGPFGPSSDSKCLLRVFRECKNWCRIDVRKGSIATQRPNFGSSLVVRSDRAGRALGRYVATELWLELGRYVATELCACLVAAYRSSLACLRSDFHTRACPRPIWIHVRCLRTIAVRKDIFTKITFRKNGYADFYGLSDIDSVVTDFDPNNASTWHLHFCIVLVCGVLACTG
ncbi:hypothetical protein IGI04_034735 [Brassica rapa subsp. trilocularis]|uniref:Uncharacterized protein n=1 Tax=Brassica rapa subsp. trilocularis TaxID=1813537 RepID=A0ABQ7L9M4_BRACM|nr:hypothetical protein IGI04_034735 [Brassica rapa subsp. trilocularis]